MFDIGSILSIGASYLGGIASMKDARNRYIAQVKSAVKSTNYDLQNFNQMRVDAYESTVEELVKIRSNQQAIQSSVMAGLNENHEAGGHTHDLLERAMQGDEARAVSSVQQNLLKQNQEINYNMLMSQLNLQGYVNSIEKPQYKSMMVNNLVNTYAGIMQVNDREKSLALKGYETNIWGKIVPKKSDENYTSIQQYPTNPSLSLAEKDWLGKATEYNFKTPLGIYWETPKEKTYF